MSSPQKLTKQEQFYQTQSLFKRNRRYLDNDSMDKLKNMLETQRRMPQARSLSSSERFDRSFTNSKVVFKDRLDKEIKRYKERMDASKDEDAMMDVTARTDGTGRSDFQVTPRKIKGVPLSLVLPRKDIVQTSKDPADERLFNNFRLSQPNTSRTVDFSKRLGRSSSSQQQPQQNQQVDITKKHQQFYYKQTTLKCLFNYKVQKDHQGRIWMFKKRPQNQPSTPIDPNRVKTGFQLTNGYSSVKINPFFNNSGRELPPQLEMKRMRSNENHWKDQSGKYQRPKLEFSLRQQRQALKDRRMVEIGEAKRPRIVKEEMCLEKYFRRDKE